jgi:hypothetical protein
MKKKHFKFRFKDSGNEFTVSASSEEEAISQTNETFKDHSEVEYLGECDEQT